jgi:hypothetical protein
MISALMLCLPSSCCPRGDVSLHAQREACEAFIRSQRGEGWRLIETAYDDGGLSGGTPNRTADS